MLNTIPITDTTAVLAFERGLASAVSFGATSDTANAKLDVELVFADAAGNIVGDTGPITLVCGAVKDWPLSSPPTLYRGKPQLLGDPSYRATGVMVYVSVLKLTPPTAKWTLSAYAVNAPGVMQD